MTGSVVQSYSAAPLFPHFSLSGLPNSLRWEKPGKISLPATARPKTYYELRCDRVVPTPGARQCLFRCGTSGARQASDARMTLLRPAHRFLWHHAFEGMGANAGVF